MLDYYSTERNEKAPPAGLRPKEISNDLLIGAAMAKQCCSATALQHYNNKNKHICFFQCLRQGQESLFVGIVPLNLHMSLDASSESRRGRKQGDIGTNIINIDVLNK